MEEKMEIINGKAVFQGIAIGKIFELKKKNPTVRKERVADIKKEQERFESAKKKACEQLGNLYEKAVKEVGEASAAIFEVHQMMLNDEDYLDSVENIITSQEANAEYAIAATGDNFAHIFSSMDDAYMKERAADVKDISERIISIMNDTGDVGLELVEPCIVVADDLTPSETMQLDKNKVLAFVTRQGSANSHTAILARTMNIPAIINAQVPGDVNGKTGIVDGFCGQMIINPEKEILEDYSRREKEEEEKRKNLLELKGKPTIAKSGKEIRLYANIGGVGDIEAVLQNDAAGIGLFRSEFLYLQTDHYPTEEEQFHTYKTVAERMDGKKVIIRTLDIGADKQIDYFDLDKEENPALGYRAVRICLNREGMFKTQLRALLRASFYGNIAVMVPMIISLWEVKRVKEILSDIRAEFMQQKIPFGEVEFGIMIETPAAVMIADELAKEVDFFSIGTNDLTQYTLAIDRQNPKLDMFYDAHHPAILRMIQMVVDSAHKVGIWAGICGELGADLEMTETFIKMGVDEFSVAPAMILPIRARILEQNEI